MPYTIRYRCVIAVGTVGIISQFLLLVNLHLWDVFPSPHDGDLLPNINQHPTSSRRTRSDEKEEEKPPSLGGTPWDPNGDNASCAGCACDISDTLGSNTRWGGDDGIAKVLNDLLWTDRPEEGILLHVPDYSKCV